MPSKDALENYIPSPTQAKQAQALVTLLQQCDAEGIIVTVFGGYGLDALYGKLTREHRDFDLVVEPSTRPQLERVLVSQGYTHIPAWSEPGRKEMYTHPDFAEPFAAEVATFDPAMLPHLVQQYGIAIAATALFPETHNGRLLNYPLRTPTLEGVAIINRIQQQTGLDRGWTEFAHEEHQALLLALLKERASLSA